MFRVHQGDEIGYRRGRAPDTYPVPAGTGIRRATAGRARRLNTVVNVSLGVQEARCVSWHQVTDAAVTSDGDIRQRGMDLLTARGWGGATGLDVVELGDDDESRRGRSLLAVSRVTNCP